MCCDLITIELTRVFINSSCTFKGPIIIYHYPDTDCMLIPRRDGVDLNVQTWKVYLHVFKLFVAVDILHQEINYSLNLLIVPPNSFLFHMIAIELKEHCSLSQLAYLLAFLTLYSQS